MTAATDGANAEVWAALRSSSGHTGWTATEPEQHDNLWCVTLVLLLGVEEDEGGPYWSYGEPVYAWGKTPAAARAEAVRMMICEAGEAS